MNRIHYPLLILGSGPAGCTAAIYAARANIHVAMITGNNYGGRIILANKIDNWPGEYEGISGTDLMEKMIKHTQNLNVKLIYDYIQNVDLSKTPFSIYGSQDLYTCDALIIATGATAKSLGLKSEQKYLGNGVSTCAVCDGFFYKNKNVIVVGGGNTAIGDALYLSKIVKQLTLIHRKNTFRADDILIEKLMKTKNINLELNNIVIEIIGNEIETTGVFIENINTKEIKKLTANGIFIAIGHQPNTQIFSQLDKKNDYLLTGFGSITGTSISGIFAAGDVVFNNQQQAVVAAASGCIAALDAKSFLTTLTTKNKT